MTKLPFLFEIGTEEIPASYLDSYATQMSALLDGFLKDSSIGHGTIKCAYTPRRIAVFCPEVEALQPVMESDVKGPPVAVAFKDGEPAKAALAFAEKCGLPISEVGRIEEGGKEYLMAHVKKGGAKTMDLLAAGLPGLVRDLRSPKSMHWDSLPTVFARPIRSLVALLGEDIVPCDLDGLAAGRHVKGHRFLSPAGFDLARADFEAYKKGLQENCVLLEFEDRRLEIERQLLALGARKETLDQDLVKTCANLTEYPKAVKGGIARDFLALPPEVLITTLKKHQKSFPCYDAEGRLEAAFLSVTNNDLKDEATIRTGYERVISARLSDAKFFYDEDRRTKLADRTEKLGSVVFQKSIGTYLDKVRRVAALCDELGRLCNCKEAAGLASKAALLSRSDLVTAMVFEFPELQGTMGRVYAGEVDGVERECAAAIEEMYQPRSASDAVAASLPGAILSIADKLDTIIGCVMVGLAPTGSADPYMLRRQTFGMLKTILSHGLDFDLKDLSRTAIELLFKDSESFKESLARNAIAKSGAGSVLSDQQVRELSDIWFEPLSAVKDQPKQLVSLLSGRFETVLKDCGISYDIIQSLFLAPWSEINATYKKAQQLEALKGDSDFQTLCNMLTRCNNIAKDEKKGKAAASVNPSLFSEEAEKALWSAWENTESKALSLCSEKRFDEAVRLLAKNLAKPLDEYFASVRIYADDKNVAANRLAVLKAVSGIILSNVADLTKVVAN